MVVVLEFRERKEVFPVVLSLVDEQPEVLFQLLVDTFRLSVTLRVVGRSGCYLDSEYTVQLSSEFRYELWTSVGNDPPGSP